MQILDPFHPMFERPLTRLLTTILPILWSGLEFFAFNAPLWGAVFLVAGLYAGYMLFIVRPKGPDGGQNGGK
ncbi:hypothetical protein [Paracoccus sp. IB05]|uniref:hypothetical protein n=1 Tax=Paracoccus sp. IB05 TaxID=2779367 RepID=UPI0018E8814B|nr:hypothetical protein [Paracoccus sp. IB05]MBJ2151170.1 hypothetical protein [Paracoccus sp. IB05]